MFAADFETCLIQPGLPAPPPVCLAAWREGARPDLIPSSSGWGPMREQLKRIFSGQSVWFNAPFDIGVALQWFPGLIDQIFEALDSGRVYDLAILERLIEISEGRPARYDNLASITARYGVAELDKESSPRLDYARLLGRPLSEYPESYIQYPKKDAESTGRTWERARSRGKRVSLEAIASETRAAVWLHLCASWGVRTNAENVESLRRAATEAVEQLREQVESYGFIRPDGSKDTKVIKQAVWDAYGESPPLAKTGQQRVKDGLPWELKHIATNKVALADSGEPRLEGFAKYGEWAAVLNKDIDMLRGGLELPIHTRYGMADTTRTTSSGPNMQNFRRLEGVRECVVPRPGKVFGQIDVSGLELGTLAQVINWKLGRREMIDLINDDTDLHLLAAARLNGWDYKDALRRLKVEHDKHVKEQRQFCKIANFGYPGFMGAATLVPYARQQDTRITLEQAIDLKANWKKTLPSAAAYLRWIKTCRNPRTDRYDFLIPGSPDILRAGATIASCANGHFQGLGAQGMKRAGWNVTKEAWTNRSSALYGQKMVLFIHDEFIFEISPEDVHPVMTEAQRVLLSSLREIIPDVKFKADPAAMPFWTKDAETVRDKKGELIVWQP